MDMVFHSSLTDTVIDKYNKEKCFLPEDACHFKTLYLLI